MVSLRQKVFKFLDGNPTVINKILKEVFKANSWNSVRTYKNQYYKQSKPDISNDISSGKKKGKKSKNEDEVDIDPLLEGMTDLEVLHFHYRKKVLLSNPDLRVLDSFRQFLKELDTFEKAKLISEVELEENLQQLGVDELVQLALGKMPSSFSLGDESSDSSSPLDNS